MAGKLYFTVGLPRSGKSTYCDKWIHGDKVMNHMENTFFAYVYMVDKPRVIVAGDDFRAALHGQAYQYESECMVFAAMDVATRALLLRNFDVIIDETCTTEQTLYRRTPGATRRYLGSFASETEAAKAVKQATEK